MHLIYLGFTAAILLLNVAGLSLLSSRFLPVLPLARAAGVLTFCLAMFFIEHFAGLGNLAWMWPITTIVSVWVIWSQRASLGSRGFWRAELVFVLAFLYGFIWRFSFPDLDTGSEHLSDLYYIANYFPGNTLPPLDRWYPPHAFNFYYAFQHYSAALMARIFGMEIGAAYNFAFALLMALPVTLAWYITSCFVKVRWHRILLIVALVSGGTGISSLQHLLIDNTGMEPYWESADRVIVSQRFIGDGEIPREHHVYTPLGERINSLLKNEKKVAPGFVLRQMPQETFGYQYFLGDYHPPIGGFFLLMFALALIAALETAGAGRIAQAFLALSVPAVLITQTWVFPLHGFLVLAWVAYRYWKKEPPDWTALIAGGLIGFLLVYPFLSEFIRHDGNISIRLVSLQDHTPVSRFIAQHWPLMVLVLLGMTQPATRKLSFTIALTFGLLLLISEVIYVDDPSGEQYERTNTTMKWWGWIWVGGLVSIGSICLGSTARYARWGAVATLGLVSVLAYDVGRYFVLNDRSDHGHIEGHYWYTQNPGNRDLFKYLKAAPDGILLENQYDNAYVNTGIHALFAGKVALLGWVAHLATWHGEIPDVWILQAQIKAFYQGGMPNALDWLLANNVQYVVWGPVESSKNAPAFSTINQSIEARYVWKGFVEDENARIGVWVRRR